jgi:hypothetical protein
VIILPMNAQRPIPLRPDYRARDREAVGSFVRACIATGMGTLDKTAKAAEHVARQWPDDRVAALVTRGAVAPFSTDSAASLVQVSLALLSALQPMSAAADLFTRAIALDFSSGVVSVPNIAPVQPGFVGEGQPIPVQQALTGPGPVLEPKKLALLVGVSGEMIRHADSEKIIRQVLVESTGPALDKVVFSTDAGDDTKPAGLLHGVSPLTPVAGADQAAMIGDLKQLAQAVAAVAGNGGVVFIMPPSQHVAMSTLPNFPYAVLESGTLAEGTVIAVAVAGLVSSTAGPPKVDASAAAVVHEHDQPAEIIDDAGTLAVPVRSFYQSDSLSMRLRWPLSWGRRSDLAVAWLTGATW